jgi:SAM-dependent methyltransferase
MEETGGAMRIKDRLFNSVRLRRFNKKLKRIKTDRQLKPALDVGCGAFPIPGADFICDYKNLEIDSSYSPEFRTRLKNRAVRCDVQNLPFRDKVFELVHCSNVLEHVDNPRQAFKELLRVGNHGYFECPCKFRENYLHHPAGHKWIINWKGGDIVIEQPAQIHIGKIQILPPPFSHWFKKNCKILWKCYNYLIDQILHISYNKFWF